ncbi:MAG: type I secretion system permease/ATPase [Sphingobium sp.]
MMDAPDINRAAPVNRQAEAKLRAIFAHTKKALVTVAVVSAVLNVLLLGGSIYMMLVYDLVLPSHSVATLTGLAVLVLVVYIFQGILDFLRGRLLIHFGATVDVDLNRDIHGLICLLSRGQNDMDGMQPVRDLDQLRSFLSGPGPTALVDLPWMLFFIIILFLLHPWLGITVLIGGAVLVFLTYLTERLTNVKSGEMMKINTARMRLAEATRRHAEVLYANGMQRRMEDRWVDLSGRFLTAQERLSGVTASLSNITKILRMVLQSGVLTVGALLVLDQQATGGVIFASSIISSRALAPVEAAIANWRGFVGARQSWTRLKALIGAMPEETGADVLPPPKQALSVENLTLGPPGTGRNTVRDVSFEVKAGEAVAIIGPSGCGKSTLARALVGIWPLVGGHVRLDGADLRQWSPEVIGRHIGYVPQNVELLDGTIAQNIARFEADAKSEDVIAAARLADVHELILRLPEGYNSQVGTDGRALSGGQRQRIALARALYGEPLLLVLDEPNSNLDNEGEQALAKAIAQVRERGAITIIVAHRPSILTSVDLVLLMVDGVAKAFGPKQKIVPGLLPPAGADRQATGNEA